MRKILPVLLCLLLIVAIPYPVFASEPLVPVIDGADLFTDDEHKALEQKARSIMETYEMDVVILTIESLDGISAQTYADDYYDDHGYGYGENDSGVLFLIAMESREWYMSTCGDAIYAITDYGIESIFSEMSWYLSDGMYYEAFDAYLDELPIYFEAYREGSPIDGYIGSYDGPGYYEPGYRDEIVYYEEPTEFGGQNILISLVIGAVAALVTLLIMRSMMNTKRPQRDATGYLKAGSYELRIQRDMFLYSTVSKTRKPDSDSRGGGGSSVHRSSGGSRHGGGGGRF